MLCIICKILLENHKKGDLIMGSVNSREIHRNESSQSQSSQSFDVVKQKAQTSDTSLASQAKSRKAEAVKDAKVMKAEAMRLSAIGDTPILGKELTALCNPALMDTLQTDCIGYL
jgi:hypothetical protein